MAVYSAGLRAGSDQEGSECGEAARSGLPGGFVGHLVELLLFTDTKIGKILRSWQSIGNLVIGNTTCNYFDFRAKSESDPAVDQTIGNSVIWVSWETQRRTTELSKALRVRLYQYLYSGPRLLRYLVLTVQTWRLLGSERPSVLIVQNPSLILAAGVAILKRFLGFKLVVDRHTNFMINREPTIQIRILKRISDFSLRNSDMTIVTNAFLADLVEEKGSPSFVLPDRIPQPPVTRPADLGAGRHICFICTYADDEPYNEMIGVAPMLPSQVKIHITGRKEKAVLTEESQKILAEYDNVVLTGFLAENDYWTLLMAVDGIVDLTTLDHCLVCGAYEGLALGKPLILSRKPINRELFGDAPVLVDPDSEDILDGVVTLLSESLIREEAIRALHDKFVADWNLEFSRMKKLLQEMIAI